MHYRYSLIAGLLALAAAGTANAQSRPVSGTVTRPAVDPSVAKTTARPSAISPTTLNSGTVSGNPISVIAAGRYQLGLNVQKRNGIPMAVVVIDDTVAVARSGSGVTIGIDSMSLTGSVSGPHFTVAGEQSNPAMSLSLAGSGSASGSAAGTFSLQRGPATFTGTFTLVPVPVTAQAHDVITRPAGGHGGGTTSCNLWCRIKNALGL